MTGRIKRYLVLIILIFFYYLLQGQNFSDWKYTLYTQADGLPSSFIFDITQDEKGFIWLATTNGLSRFDGYQFKNFYPSVKKNHTNSLSSGSLRILYRDTTSGLFYLGTSGGLNIFDPKTESFNSFLHNPLDSSSIPENDIRDIYRDRKGRLWVGTHFGGFAQLIERDSIVTFKTIRPAEKLHPTQEKKAQAPHNLINSITNDPIDDDVLWMGTLDGYLKYYITKDSFELFRIDSTQVTHWSGGEKTGGRFQFDQNKVGWSTSWGGGLIKFDPDNNKWEAYKTYTLGMPGNRTIRVYPNIDQNGQKFWVCTDNGLATFNSETEEFHFIEYPQILQESVRGIITYSLLITENGTMWIGTRLGLLKLKKKDINSIRINSRDIPYTGNKFGEIGHICQFSNSDTILIGTSTVNRKTPLHLYDLNKRQFLRSIPFQQPLNLYDGINSIAKIYPYKDDLIFLANTGLHRFSTKNFRSESYFPTKKFIETIGLVDDTMLDNAQKNLWYSSRARGLIKVNLDSLIWKQYTKDSTGLINDYSISSLLEDHENNIWLCSAEGLSKLDPKTDSFSYYPLKGNKSLRFPVLDPNCMVQDDSSYFWIGTNGGGLIKFNPRSKQIISVFTIEEGLPGNVIYDIQKDLSGNLWMIVEGGIVLFNPYEEDIRVFTEKDDMPKDLSLASIGRFNSGHIYITSENSVIFHPDSIREDQTQPTLAFTSFKVLNEEYQKNINYERQIHLNYNQNFFSFEFAALTYHKSEENQYEYQLKGIDSDWVKSGTRRIANYTQVKEGEYYFTFRGTNSDGVWNQKGKTINIIIYPPWYRSSWAYSIYILISILGFYSIYYYWKQRWKLQTELQLEQAEAIRLKELDEFKNHLYTNITHEFRTPLTVVIGAARQIKNNAKVKLEKHLEMIERNADRLLSLINQMLDLSKLESGKMKLSFVQADIIQYLQYLTESFHSLTHAKHINLSFYSEVDLLIMDYDMENLERIMTNLLSNAIKYTREYGKIQVIAKTNHSSLFIQVRDSGVGIRKEDLPHIFDRFYQVDASTTRKGEGTGIGLAFTKELVALMDGSISVESEIHKGSKFTINLPIHHNAPLASKELPGLSTKKNMKGIDKVKIESTFLPKTNAINASAKNGHPIILIVEDNQDLAEYLDSYLGNNYSLVFAWDGKTGVDKAIELIPDIIISDVMMPEMDGFELCERLKNNELTSHIPIILLTAKGTIKDKILGLKKGADAYLAKPFNHEELNVRISQLISSRKKIQLKFSQNGGLYNIWKDISKTEVAFLDRINHIIEENISDEDFGIPQLLKTLGISRSQLYRKLKQLTGQSASIYFQQVKMNKAKQLLNSTDFTIAEIAYKVGFKDPAYFTRVFKDNFGHPPSETRK